jgi:squalene-associated FAD-dependent desaturase
VPDEVSRVNDDRPAIVVGGGLAGLAAAVALAAHRVPVVVLESRPRLGGRAGSFVDRETGRTIDNCQHVALGCCTNFLDFCRRLGLDDLLVREPALFFVGPDGRTHRFAAGRWPAPLHLLPAFRGLGYLDRADRRRLASGIRRLARTDPAQLAGLPFADWLARNGQTARLADRFWHVLLVSALSETLDRIDAAAARKVIVDGFLRHRDGWAVWRPRGALDDLYGERLVEWLAEHGGSVRTGAGVRQILADGPDRVSGVALRSGDVLPAGDVILAVPQHLVRDLVPEGLRDDPALVAAERLETAPISGAHLWFDRPLTDLPHAVFVERTCQWLFHRDLPLPRDSREDEAPLPDGAEHAVGTKRGDEEASGTTAARSTDGTRRSDCAWYCQIVVSASREFVGRPQAEVLGQIVEELRSIWPRAREARLLHARLVTEHRAVFSPTPGSEALRPAQQTPVANLQVAGDWTRTGWPATMEGAVRSGYLAAENVLARRGERVPVVQPDLPAARLSRWLFGLR